MPRSASSRLTADARSLGTRTVIQPACGRVQAVRPPPGCPAAARTATRRSDLVRADQHAHLGAAGQQLVERPLAHQPAVVDDAHDVRQLLHLGQDVAGDEHGLAAVREVAQQLAHGHDARRIEPVGRLVEQQQVRVGQQRDRDAQALLMPRE